MSLDCSKCIPRLCQGDCCIYVPLPRELWEKFKHLAQQEVVVLGWEKGKISVGKTVTKDVLPLTGNLKCPFLSKDFKCVIYEDRPWVCRLFGVGEKIGAQCYYMKPSGKLRGKNERAKRVKECEDQLNMIVKNLEKAGEVFKKL